MRISDYTLRNLRTFCAMVEHGGPSGAQAVLGASLSAISIHLKDLELSLGFTLCQRGRSGFALTDKGEAVYREAKRMLGGIEQCEANLGTLRKVRTGHLRIGIVDSEADNPDLPIHRAIRRFFGREHEVRLTLEIGTTQALSKALQTGEVHVAIGPFPNRQPNVEYTPVYTEEHGLYCGRLHPLYARAEGAVTLEELSLCPITARPYLQRSELAALHDPNVAASVSNMEAQAILIRSGRFLGFLPLHFANTWVRRGEMRQITGLGLEWLSQFHIALRVQPEPLEIARLFAADLADELARA
ncbi:DNA-binding transcriptional regulator, LysR family [Paracoccus aminovorans]|uniref:DNA-binding transcriptional regulator, LysR family n=1 Tax=Paracoccus aminovorans TaxID=34004 RepID=A0A1I3ELV7_9RHOB|nr:LysR family transcriptional regulator [Paracoccus aminovorans]CQR84608.1 LysR family transcriptional regulator [Paracoccus aminovorans]SFH99942.1 DNA-binding transcriptional regulator, LysR family [Paracoccus aminovorans]